VASGGDCEKSFFAASLKRIVIRAGNMLYLNSRAALAERQVTTRSQGALEAFGLEQEIHLSQATQLPMLRSLESKTDGDNERLTTINDVTMKDVTMTDETVYDNNATVNSEVATELQEELLDMSYIQVADNSFFALGDEDDGEESQDGNEEGTPDGCCDVTIQVGPLSEEMRQIYQQHVFKGGNGSFRALKPALELLSNLVDSPESYHLCKELLNGVHQELLSHQASKKKSSKSNPDQNAEYATMPQLARNRIYRRAGIGNSPSR